MERFNIQIKSVLENYVKAVPFTKDKYLLGNKLKAVAQELSKAADEVLSVDIQNLGFYSDDGKYESNPVATNVVS